MNAGIDALRLLRARWSVLAAAAPLLSSVGTPLPFRITVQGAGSPSDAGASTGNGVARYHASASAGATLVWFDDDRAVLSGGDESWTVPDAADARSRIAAGPPWADHVLLLDPRIRESRYGWASFHEGGHWSPSTVPEAGAPLPPVLDTTAAARALASRLYGTAAATAFHLVRMCEYEWLDRIAWRATFSAASEPLVSRSWELLVESGLTRWTGDGPRTDGVPGRTEEQALEVAAQFARARGVSIPDDVRVESALCTPQGWQVRMVDYRDADHARALVISVPETGGAAQMDSGAAGHIRIPGRTPG